MQNTSSDINQMDPYVVEYIKDKMVKVKFGSDVEEQFLMDETNKMYAEIEDGIFNLAYNQLPEDKQKELEELVNNGGSIVEIQEFMQKNVTNLVEQIRDYMVMTTESYLTPES